MTFEQALFVMTLAGVASIPIAVAARAARRRIAALCSLVRLAAGLSKFINRRKGWKHL